MVIKESPQNENIENLSLQLELTKQELHGRFVRYESGCAKKIISTRANVQNANVKEDFNGTQVKHEEDINGTKLQDEEDINGTQLQDEEDINGTKLKDEEDINGTQLQDEGEKSSELP